MTLKQKLIRVLLSDIASEVEAELSTHPEKGFERTAQEITEFMTNGILEQYEIDSIVGRIRREEMVNV